MNSSSHRYGTETLQGQSASLHVFPSVSRPSTYASSHSQRIPRSSIVHAILFRELFLGVKSLSIGNDFDHVADGAAGIVAVRVERRGRSSREDEQERAWRMRYIYSKPVGVGGSRCHNAGCRLLGVREYKSVWF
jgi:hypothetical protein